MRFSMYLPKKIFGYLTKFLVIMVVCTATVSAQKESDEPTLTRTVRVLLAGTRPMPAFERKGNQVIEVDPPLSACPPTSISFEKPEHAPRSSRTKKPVVEYSIWPGELIILKKYKGPSQIGFILKTPLIAPDDTGVKVECDMGTMINPLIVITPGEGREKWRDPKLFVIDVGQEKFGESKVLVINDSSFPLRVQFAKDPVYIKPKKFGLVPLAKGGGDTHRYQIDSKIDNEVVRVSNSSYRSKSGVRLIILAMPSKAKKSPLALRLITETVE